MLRGNHLDDQNFVACENCFINEGLRLSAASMGENHPSACSRCGAKGGAKLSMKAMARLANTFFLQGSVIRATFGAAPYITFNDKRKTEINESGWPSRDALLFEEIMGIGFFYYGPPIWSVGIISPLEDLLQKGTRDETITRILQAYETTTLTRNDKFYRVRKNPDRPLDHSQYDSPPVKCENRSSGRLDTTELPILYASPDLQTCLHECRVMAEDELFLATLKPAHDVKLLNLAKFLEEVNVDPSESLDHAVSMLFLAGEHAYPITREIALAACKAGYDGLIYPSFYSMLRNGMRPFETFFGLSKRNIPQLRKEEESKFVPNLGIFGKPVEEGLVEVSSINRVLLKKVAYSVQFGPVLDVEY